MNTEPNQQPETALAAIEQLGITIAAEFVPYGQSKDAKKNPKLSDLGLNWNVTISVKGREILTTHYGAGVAHSPNYKQFGMTSDDAEAVLRECKTGIRHRGRTNTGIPIHPKISDVLYCLVSDADAIDHPTFASWASDLGYDPDSRKAEAIYRACLETGLKLRAALGDDGLQKLRDAFQDY